MFQRDTLVTQIRSHSEKILISSVFCAAVILSFIGGTLYERDQKESSRLVVNIPDYKQASGVAPIDAEKESVTSDTPALEAISAQKGDSISVGSKLCPYAGSKNSDKYHLASCGVVKRIKPENIRCFASTKIAEEAGYVAGCLK